MFGSKKKKENKGLPDLPESMKSAPSLKGYTRSKFQPSPADIPPTNKEEPHGLPSFPDSPMQKGFSQSAIKDAVETPNNKQNPTHGLPELPDENQETNKIPPVPENHRVMEMEEWEPQVQNKNHLVKNQSKGKLSNKPIFIRLEKFKEAKEYLDDIKIKLNEMDELLKMIKEVKMKENEEIMQWEKEIEKVKSRINSINSDIFENVY